jgi:hypothetical protein
MTKSYNLKNIRILLTEGFTDEQLRRLCFEMPEFRPVYDQLAESTGKTDIIDLLLEYAYQTLQIDKLLDWAKEYNPIRYEEHQPYYENITDKREPPPYLTKLSSFKDRLTGNQIYNPIRQITDRVFWLIVILIPVIMISLMNIDLKVNDQGKFELHIDNSPPASATGASTPTPADNLSYSATLGPDGIFAEWQHPNPNVATFILLVIKPTLEGGTVFESIPIAVSDSQTVPVTWPARASIEDLCSEAYDDPTGQSIQFQMLAVDAQGHPIIPDKSNIVTISCPIRLFPGEIVPDSPPTEIPTPIPTVTQNP